MHYHNMHYQVMKLLGALTQRDWVERTQTDCLVLYNIFNVNGAYLKAIDPADTFLEMHRNSFLCLSIVQSYLCLSMLWLFQPYLLECMALTGLIQHLLGATSSDQVAFTDIHMSRNRHII